MLVMTIVPSSGREAEMIFIAQKIADRLKEYVKAQNMGQHDRIFAICYEAARAVVKKAGNLVGIHLRPHDLRRHAATFASRAGVPLEIISKIILRHSNLSTTQIYLGKVSDSEALKWIETLTAKSTGESAWLDSPSRLRFRLNIPGLIWLVLETREITGCCRICLTDSLFF
jgi:integrase